jgi:hypothetical protein
MDLSTYQNLLNQVYTLNNHFAKINELTGDNFNVFKILKVQSSEVRLHSAFLAELLDPAGTHGKKDIFLRLFVESICSKGLMFDTSSAKVDIEKHTGFITQDGLEGGRIDIIITDKFNKHIIIENKIYAGDQVNQLVRYYNYSPGAEIIYLSLDGKVPSDGSCGNLRLDEHFKCSSYASDILRWLEQCRKEVAIMPIVRESISQYINLIKHLTNQTLNVNMEKELNRLLMTNLEASFIVAKNLDNALEELTDEFVVSLTLLCDSYNLKCSSNINFDRNFTGIWICKDDWQFVNIAFQFQSYDKVLNYGFISKQDPSKFTIPVDIRNELNKIANNEAKVNKWWPWYGKLEDPYNDWSKYEAYHSILDGSMLKVIKEKLEYLLNQSNGLHL